MFQNFVVFFWYHFHILKILHGVAFEQHSTYDIRSVIRAKQGGLFWFLSSRYIFPLANVPFIMIRKTLHTVTYHGKGLCNQLVQHWTNFRFKIEIMKVVLFSRPIVTRSWLLGLSLLLVRPLTISRFSDKLRSESWSLSDLGESFHKLWDFVLSFTSLPTTTSTFGTIFILHFGAPLRFDLLCEISPEWVKKHNNWDR